MSQCRIQNSLTKKVDRSLDYWRKGHMDFFTAELDQSFSDDILVVWEEFKVIYK
ncbi:ASCH domain-containing protein [Rossellomorea sp. BNER]|uniref:ASCH domain-containing protein n=1 Tax=Rossellomorea sp. BNER TaxID=2962031 RepID=UPI003AF26946